MRILHTNMLRGWGGQSNRILTEARGTLKAGHAVAFAVPHSSVLAKKGAECGIEVLPGYEFKPPAQLWHFLPDLRRLLRDIQRWKPDIIHLHGSQDTWLTMTARKVSRRPFPPTIRTKHNIFDWKTHPTNRWLYGQVDAYISISSYIDRQIVDYPGLSGKPRALIPSVPDVPRFSEPVSSIRGQIPNIPEGAFLWGSTGRLRSEKGFDVLLNAFALVRKARPNTHLIIAGDGSERAKLEGQARLLELGPEAVQFLGFRKDIPEVLASLDGYVLTSRSEGLGTAILEALAVGLPVVATRVGGIPDSVHHEKTGLLAETENPGSIAEAMIRMMDDKKMRENLSVRAKQLVFDVFTEDNLIAKTVEFYERIARR